MTNVHGISVSGGSFPAQIWRRFMDPALAGLPARDFPEPASRWCSSSGSAGPGRSRTTRTTSLRCEPATTTTEEATTTPARRRTAPKAPAPAAKPAAPAPELPTRAPPGLQAPSANGGRPAERELRRRRSPRASPRPASSGSRRPRRGARARRSSRATAASPTRGRPGRSSRCSSPRSPRTSSGSSCCGAASLALRAAILVAAAVQLVPLGAPLLLSTDAWTYWGYGWIAAEGGGNPYVDPPSAFPESPAAPYLGADWRDTTTVYGPAFTLVSEPVARIAGLVVRRGRVALQEPRRARRAGRDRRGLPELPTARARGGVRRLEPRARGPRGGRWPQRRARRRARRDAPSRSACTAGATASGAVWALAVARQVGAARLLRARGARRARPRARRRARSASSRPCRRRRGRDVALRPRLARRARPARRQRRARDELRASLAARAARPAARGRARRSRSPCSRWASPGSPGTRSPGARGSGPPRASSSRRRPTSRSGTSRGPFRSRRRRTTTGSRGSPRSRSRRTCCRRRSRSDRRSRGATRMPSSSNTTRNRPLARRAANGAAEPAPVRPPGRGSSAAASSTATQGASPRTGKLKTRRRSERCAPSVFVALTGASGGITASARRGGPGVAPDDVLARREVGAERHVAPDGQRAEEDSRQERRDDDRPCPRAGSPTRSAAAAAPRRAPPRRTAPGARPAV